jgi:2TM domain
VSDDLELRERVERRVKRRYKFYRDLAAFASTNVLLWGIYLISNGGRSSGVPWPLWVTFFWGIGIVREAWEIFGSSRFSDANYEAEVQREIARERERLYGAGYEKPKRSEFSVGDDGELVYSDEADAKRKHAAER